MLLDYVYSRGRIVIDGAARRYAKRSNLLWFELALVRYLAGTPILIGIQIIKVMSQGHMSAAALHDYDHCVLLYVLNTSICRRQWTATPPSLIHNTERPKHKQALCCCLSTCKLAVLLSFFWQSIDLNR